MDLLIFSLRKKLLTKENSAKVASYEKIRKWKTGLINKANGSKVVYLSAYSNAGPFKDRFPLVCWTFAYVLIRYDTIQKRQTKVNFLYQLYLNIVTIRYVPCKSGKWPYVITIFVKKNALHWLKFWIWLNTNKTITQALTFKTFQKR